MLINLLGNWVNPQNILAVVSGSENPEEKIAKVVFASTAECGFALEYKDKTVAEVAAEINAAIAANRKPAFEKRGGDRGGFKGGDRDRGGDRGGFKKKFDKPSYGSDDHKEKIRKDFGDRKNGKKFESRDRGDFKPKKRKEW